MDPADEAIDNTTLLPPLDPIQHQEPNLLEGQGYEQQDMREAMEALAAPAPSPAPLQAALLSPPPPHRESSSSGSDSEHTVSETTNIGDWSAQRFDLDGKITLWADGLHMIDLKGDLNWYSGAAGQDMSKPYSICVMHFLNHQTHHRGQVHAMLTAAGQSAPVSDLALMPEG